MPHRFPKYLIALACAVFTVSSACTFDSTNSSEPTEPAGGSGAMSTATPRSSIDPASPTGERSSTPTVAGGVDATPRPPATATTSATPAPTPEATPSIPASAYLEPMTHAYQTWNNCSAVSASMVLSHFGITTTQDQLATVFRPNLADKHVEPRQIVDFFPKYGLEIRLVEGGTVERIKALVAAGIPVITPQWLNFDPDAIGHYRVVRGYDDQRGGFIVNDSMTGPDVFYSYDDFGALWRAFNFRYLPVFRPEQRDLVNGILGVDTDREQNLRTTLQRMEELANANPEDAYLWFSVGSNYFELGQFTEAVAAYERADALGLPPKMLWYQFWPVAAYNLVGDHQRALDLALEQITSAGTFGEMHYQRGQALEALGERDGAIGEYRQALIDDANLTRAQEALSRLGG